MAELSRVSGVPVATIKFYLREGLVPPGERTGPNQAEYAAAHVERLALVRTLREAGELSIATIREVVSAMETSTGFKLLASVVDAIDRRSEPPNDTVPASRERRATADRDVDAFLRGRGWLVRPNSAARQRLVDALLALQLSPFAGVTAESFGPYADAVEPLARAELMHTLAAARDGNATAMVATVVTGTLLWERALVALRRAAEEHAATELENASPRARESSSAALADERSE